MNATEQKKADVMELTDEALAHVVGGAGKNAQFITYSNTSFYSNSNVNSRFLKKKKR